MATFEIIGEWSGPASPAGDFTRVCHREYTTREKFAEEIAKLGTIQFTDGTMLFLRIHRRTGRGRKRQPEILGYRKLIRDCLLHGVSRVADLPTK